MPTHLVIKSLLCHRSGNMLSFRKVQQFMPLTKRKNNYGNQRALHFSICSQCSEERVWPFRTEIILSFIKSHIMFMYWKIIIYPVHWGTARISTTCTMCMQFILQKIQHLIRPCENMYSSITYYTLSRPFLQSFFFA